MQKFSTRMDGLAKGVEQHLKEAEMCKAAIEASGEKAVAEMGDVGKFVMSWRACMHTCSSSLSITNGD